MIGLFDVDEVPMPMVHSSLGEMIANLPGNKNYSDMGGLVLRNVYFFTNLSDPKFKGENATLFFGDNTKRARKHLTAGEREERGVTLKIPGLNLGLSQVQAELNRLQVEGPRVESLWKNIL